jgi:hypothetical protein
MRFRAIIGRTGPRCALERASGFVRDHPDPAGDRAARITRVHLGANRIRQEFRRLVHRICPDERLAAKRGAVIEKDKPPKATERTRDAEGIGGNVHLAGEKRHRQDMAERASRG